MDNAITRTDDDALAARASAVKLGYWSDPYIKCFVKSVDRRAPIINRGTFVRAYAIDSIISHFLKDASATNTGTLKIKQIINLGAGSDTRFFNLAQRYIQNQEEVPFRYHEIDFPHVCQRKALTVTSKLPLRDILYYKDNPVQINACQGSIHSTTYSLHPLDLNSIDTAQLSGIQHDLETLVISEVCLIYMTVESADMVLDWTSKFPNCVTLIYEPIRGDDQFGQMMIKNLALRGLELKTMTKYGTLEAQRARLSTAGYQSVKACTMDQVYDDWLSSEERERIARLEMFDEIEEWIMLAQHYCVLLGWRGLPEGSPLVRYFQ